MLPDLASAVSPSALLTALAAVALPLLYYCVVHAVARGKCPVPGVSGKGARPMAEATAAESRRPRDPVQLGSITKEELLRIGTGADPTSRIYIAIKGTIYDVTPGEDFYGPDGPYAKFAGRDASYALAKMSLKEEDVHGDTSGLSAAERDILDDWIAKFQDKYTVCGVIATTEAR